MGKTSIAQTIELSYPEIRVFRFDTIGVPSAEIMATYGSDHQPGGAWQRAMTLDWMRRIAPMLAGGQPVLFEGQMRLAFIQEALQLHAISHAHILLVECSDVVRNARLTHERLAPDLANENMAGWSRYLHAEALEFGWEILDTGLMPLRESTNYVLSLLLQRSEL